MSLAERAPTTRHLLNYYRPEDVVGINISKKQLETCKINAPGCKFLLMNATELAFDDHSFDNVICVEAASHFDTRKDFLAEACRVLKPGGRLALSEVLHTRWNVAEIGLTPTENYIRGLEEYRNLYLRVGFEQVEVVDRTYECWVSFCADSVRYLRDRLVSKQIDQLTHKQRMDGLARKDLAIGYYVLTCALRGASR